MNRRDVLKRIGLLGAASLLLRPRLVGALVRGAGFPGLSPSRPGADCWLTPEKTEGPFYFDADLVRRDIAEDRTGVPLRLVFTVLGADCSPLPGVLVDIWHADKDGLYSGYDQPGGNTARLTFLRGIQVTDASGRAVFDTIYPGWYLGRSTHIHFKARLDETSAATSQFAFPEDVNAAVYATTLYAARGENPVSNAIDGVFQSETPEHLLLDVVPDGGDGYAGTFTIGVDAAVPAVRTTWGGLKNRY